MELLELARIRGEIEPIDAPLVELIELRCRVTDGAGLDAVAVTGSPWGAAGDAAVVRDAGVRARAETIDEEEVRRIFWRLIEMERRARSGRVAS